MKKKNFSPKKFTKPLALGLLLFFLIFFHFFFQGTRIIQDWENRGQQRAYDLRFSFSNSQQATDKILLVEIDEHSLPPGLSTIPLDRIWLAQFITAIARHKPKVIGLNLILDLATTPEADKTLAEAITKSGRVILRERSHPIQPLFMHAALSSGGLTWKHDSSGTLQAICHTPFSCGVKSLFHHQLWKELYPEKPFPRLEKNQEWLKVNFVSFLNVEEKKRIFRASEVEQLPPEFFRDRLVLIGKNLEGISARMKTPFTSQQQGWMSENRILDQVFHMLGEGNLSYILPAWFVTLVLLAVLIPGFFLVFFRYYWAFFFLTCFWLLFWTFGSWIGFAFYHWEIPYLFPSFLLSTFFFLSLIYCLNWEKMEGLRKELKIEKQASTLKQAKMDQLANQLDTHSLFNEFARIRGMITEDPKKAKRYLTLFSSMLRHSLTFWDKKAPPLEKQWGFIQSYLEQQKLVYEGFQFQVEVKGEIKGVYLPWNLLYAPVENAVKYTETLLSDPKNSYPIQIVLEIIDKKIYFTVINSFDEQKEVVSTQTGLANLKERLDLFYPQGDYSFESAREKNTWISRMTLPCWEESSTENKPSTEK